MIMNVSHTITQRAESQPESDSQPPDSTHRTYATALRGGGRLQISVSQIRASLLSTNKAIAIAFIASAAEMFCPWPGLVCDDAPIGWEVQKASLSLLG